MRIPTLTFGSTTFALIFALAACGGGKGTSEGDGDTSSGGGSSTTGGTPTTGASTGDDTTGATGSMTASSDPTTGPSQTASSDPTTGEAPTTGATDPGATTGGTTGDDTTGGTDETGVQPSGDAVAENECAPNDGPAVLLKLDVAEGVCGAIWPGDQLRIVVFQAAPLPANTYTLGDDVGFATLQVGMNQPLVATSGEVTIETFTADSVSGTYELTFPDDVVRAGAFTGPFCETNPMCG